MSDLSRLEIEAFVKILDELDYYQLLQVAPDVSRRDLKLAYYEISRTYHPNSTRTFDENLRESCHRISKVMTEAYCVLRDPRKRKAYDAHLESGAGMRMQLAEARAAHAKTRNPRSARARRLRASSSCSRPRKNCAGTISLEPSRTCRWPSPFEPDNAQFKELLEELRKSRKKKS